MLKALFFRLLFCFCDLKAHTRKILSQGGKKKKTFHLAVNQNLNHQRSIKVICVSFYFVLSCQQLVNRNKIQPRQNSANVLKGGRQRAMRVAGVERVRRKKHIKKLVEERKSALIFPE